MTDFVNTINDNVKIDEATIKAQIADKAVEVKVEDADKSEPVSSN